MEAAIRAHFTRTIALRAPMIDIIAVRRSGLNALFRRRMYAGPMRWRALWLVSVGLVLSAGTAGATEWHVSTTGSAAGDGSEGDPWDLVTAANGAADTIGPGDVVWARR